MAVNDAARARSSRPPESCGSRSRSGRRPRRSGPCAIPRPASRRASRSSSAPRMARKLGVPVELVEYASSGEIVASRDKGAWDVTFVPVDDDRKKAIDFGAPYHLLQSTYLIAPGSTIKTLAEANRAGVRIAIVDGTATGRASVAASPNATTVKVKNPDEAVEHDEGRQARRHRAVARVGRRAGRRAAGLARARGGVPQFHHRRGGAAEQAGGARLSSPNSSRRRRPPAWCAARSMRWD